MFACGLVPGPVPDPVIEQPHVDPDDLPPCESSSEDETDIITLKEFLKLWRYNQNVTLCALSSLLAGLQHFFPGLPKDARTLLGTPRKSPVRALGKGKFCYFGLKDQIIKNSRAFDYKKTVLLDINVDGLPLYKSTTTQFWPILAYVRDSKLKEPIVVAIYCGNDKPPVEPFLEEFVNELNDLVLSGIDIGSAKFVIKIRTFICDAPARSYLKRCVLHNAYYGCERCVVRGVHNGRVTFQDCECTLRTDDSFISQHQKDHHQKVDPRRPLLGRQVSPLLPLGVGLVSQFVLDPMHLLHLGVTRRLLFLWRTGTTYCVKCISSTQLELLNTYLCDLKHHWPKDFNREPRALSELERWKATELRQFLLYIAAALLKDILGDASYKNFLLYFVAVTILSRRDLISEYADTAQQYLVAFVKDAASLYGEEIVAYNFHSLIHLADDAKKYGVLDSFSAFIFENMLGKLKRLLKKCNQPLEQVVNRTHEMLLLPLNPADSLRDDGNKRCTPKPSETEATFQCYPLQVNDKDNFVMINNGKVVQITKFWVNNGKIDVFQGRQYTYNCELFNYPCSSDVLSIGVYNSRPSLQDRYYSMASIKFKGLMLPHGEEMVFFPLI